MDRVFLFLADSQEQLSSFSEVPEKFDELLKEGSAVFDPNSTSARDPHGRVTSTPVEVSSLVQNEWPMQKLTFVCSWVPPTLYSWV